MKAFDKYWDENGIDHYDYDKCEDTWAAALEWAKKQTGAHYDYNDDHVLHIRMDLINKELEEVRQDE